LKKFTTWASSSVRWPPRKAATDSIHSRGSAPPSCTSTRRSRRRRRSRDSPASRGQRGGRRAELFCLFFFFFEDGAVCSGTE
jgi:hypothetical protein